MRIKHVRHALVIVTKIAHRISGLESETFVTGHSCTALLGKSWQPGNAWPPGAGRTMSLAAPVGPGTPAPLL